MSKKLKFALVGCGRIAKRHSELLGLGQIPNASLSAVCDIKAEKAKAIGQKMNVPYYNNMHEMMEKEPSDVVVVLSESGLHANHVETLSKYGKHIIVEKPMALSLPDADRMIAACSNARVKLFVVKQNRFNVPVIKLREAFEQGRFGKIVMGTVRVRWSRTQQYYDQDAWRGTWAMDGGVLANQASHHVDLLEWFLGKPVSVFAIAKTASVNIEAEDTAAVLLKFENGAFGIIEATTAVRPKDLEGSISILGEKGTVVIEGFAVNKIKTWNFTPPQSTDVNILENYSVNPTNIYGFGHQAYYKHVVNSIQNNTNQMVDGKEGRKSLELISAIYQSIETGHEVYLNKQPKSLRLGKKDD